MNDTADAAPVQDVNEGYDVMRRSIMARLDISTSAKLVLISLQRWAWNGRACTVCNKTIARATGLSVTTVKQSLLSLKQFGLVGWSRNDRVLSGRSLVLKGDGIPPVSTRRKTSKARSKSDRGMDGIRLPTDQETATLIPTVIREAQPPVVVNDPEATVAAFQGVELAEEAARDFWNDDVGDLIRDHPERVAPDIQGRFDLLALALPKAAGALNVSPLDKLMRYCGTIVSKMIDAGGAIPPTMVAPRIRPVLPNLGDLRINVQVTILRLRKEGKTTAQIKKHVDSEMERLFAKHGFPTRDRAQYSKVINADLVSLGITAQ